MPSSRKELLDAALSNPRSGENRLTELLAVVLELHHGLARRLFSELELPFGDRAMTWTQERVAQGCRPDMLARTYNEQGALVSQLWSEHKTTADFRPQQLPDYQAALEGTGVKGRLLAIVSDIATTHAGAWHVVTWQRVAELANLAGVDRGGAAWRDKVVGSNAGEEPASQRALHELLWYLEEEGFAVVNALDSDDVLVFGKAANTYLGIETLLERAAEQMSPFSPTEPPGLADEGDLCWQVFDLPSGTWIEALGDPYAYPELCLAAQPDWTAADIGEPAFGAGYTLRPTFQDVLGEPAAWVERAVAHEFDLGLHAGYLRLFRTMRMSEILECGDTLEEQSHALASWASSAIGAAAELDPAPIKPEMP